jgi:hypothetical protein
MPSPEQRAFKMRSSDEREGERQYERFDNVAPPPPEHPSRAVSALLVLIGALEAVLTSGVVFGWAPMQLMLQREGIYAASCPGGKAPCPEQAVQLELIYTVATSAFCFCVWPTGFVLDRFGPRACCMMGAAFFGVGCALFAVSSNSLDLFMPGSRPPPSPRTNWTRRVPHPVRPAPRQNTPLPRVPPRRPAQRAPRRTPPPRARPHCAPQRRVAGGAAPETRCAVVNAVANAAGGAQVRVYRDRRAAGRAGHDAPLQPHAGARGDRDHHHERHDRRVGAQLPGPAAASRPTPNPNQNPRVPLTAFVTTFDAHTGV